MTFSSLRLYVFMAFVLVMTASGSAGVSASEAGLLPPFDVGQIRARAPEHSGVPSFECADVPAPVKDLIFFSVYTDRRDGVSRVNPKARARYKKALEPLSAYETGLMDMANAYLDSRKPDPAIADCVLRWLEAWAQEDALLGKVNPTGRAVRKWSLAVFASAYAQIREDEALDRSRAARVESWLRKCAWVVKEDYSSGRTGPKTRQNNHMYWAAWAVGMTGMAVQDEKLFRWAVNKTKDALRDVGADGTLELELERQSKAMHYHSFALIPLIMMAESATRNGEDLYAYDGGALHRIVNRVVGGLRDPSYFEVLTGKTQNLEGTVTSSQLAWIEVYNARFPSRELQFWLNKFRPMTLRRIGGNATLLYRKSEAPSPVAVSESAGLASGEGVNLTAVSRSVSSSFRDK